MPPAPLPEVLRPFLEAPRPAVIGTIRPDGQPSTTPTWYAWEDGLLLLSMVTSGLRLRNVRNHPQLSLTILGDSWYDHVTLLGRAVRFRAEGGFDDLDALSLRYTGEHYARTHLQCTSVLVEVERWHAWGAPKELVDRQDPPATSEAGSPSREVGTGSDHVR